eukprot:TRINITY_DN4273_c0_g1_i5.p1 TRINITY_DN4273_c0_g1~~TRINITY_DN4273_c0_g1_i5.p1  ORF type:complete len:163 (-),score=47.67 TRINITY_DN4273_c0_g1_i5:419-907(-)
MTSKLQEQLNQNQDQLKVAQAERESLRTKNDQLNKQLTELKQKIAQQEQEMNGLKGNGSADKELVDVMERQLIKLSEIIMAKDNDLVQLQKTVQNECAERAEMMKTIMYLKKENEVLRQPSISGAEAIGRSSARPASGNSDKKTAQGKSVSLPPVRRQTSSS